MGIKAIEPGRLVAQDDPLKGNGTIVALNETPADEIGLADTLEMIEGAVSLTRTALRTMHVGL